MGQKLKQGEVLVRNVDRGVDSSDSQYRILHNVDGGFDIRVKRKFDRYWEDKYTDFLDKVFDLDGFHPVVLGHNGNGACLLAPPSIEYVSPGMVVADLEPIKDYTELGKVSICLCESKTFHSDRFILEKGTGIVFYPYQYKMMVKGMNIDDGIVQAVIHRTESHIVGGIKQPFNHIQANYLAVNHDKRGFNSNLEKLVAMRDNDGDGTMYWDNVRDPEEFFKEIIVVRNINEEKREREERRERIAQERLARMAPQELKQPVRHIA